MGAMTKIRLCRSYRPSESQSKPQGSGDTYLVDLGNYGTGQIHLKRRLLYELLFMVAFLRLVLAASIRSFRGMNRDAGKV
jgi:hypothetical protein